MEVPEVQTCPASYSRAPHNRMHLDAAARGSRKLHLWQIWIQQRSRTCESSNSRFTPDSSDDPTHQARLASAGCTQVWRQVPEPKYATSLPCRRRCVRNIWNAQGQIWLFLILNQGANKNKHTAQDKKTLGANGTNGVSYFGN